jgi:SAM-dependent methyltransferase
LQGQVPVAYNYFDQAYLGGKASVPIWTFEEANDYRTRTRGKASDFSYENAPLYSFFDKRGTDIILGKRGLVIGSENPWLEGMLLEYGAQNITTVEFGKIESLHPQIQTYTPMEFKVDFLQGHIEQFDFAISYSSIEHDGLGRYGDLINPNGDLETMSKMLTIVKPGGHVMIGFPCCHDKLEWNAHRVYGPVRLPLLFAGYKILGLYPSDSHMGDPRTLASFQPLWLLQNSWGCRQKNTKIKIKLRE